MTIDELMKLADESCLGQLWIEREAVLRAVNSLPPQLRDEAARDEIRRLRRRVELEGTAQENFRVQLVGDMDRVPPKRIRRKL
jgi:hypothetical protein